MRFVRVVKRTACIFKRSQNGVKLKKNNFI